MQVSIIKVLSLIGALLEIRFELTTGTSSISCSTRLSFSGFPPHIINPITRLYNPLGGEGWPPPPTPLSFSPFGDEGGQAEQ